MKFIPVTDADKAFDAARSTKLWHLKDDNALKKCTAFMSVTTAEPRDRENVTRYAVSYADAAHDNWATCVLSNLRVQVEE